MSGYEGLALTATLDAIAPALRPDFQLRPLREVLQVNSAVKLRADEVPVDAIVKRGVRKAEPLLKIETVLVHVGVYYTLTELLVKV
jgi:hypothetical protein